MNCVVIDRQYCSPNAVLREQTGIPKMHSKELTEKAIGCACKVGNVPGNSFLEKFYENGLAYDFRNKGLKVEQ